MENYRKLKPRLRRFVDLIVQGARNGDAALAVMPDSRAPHKLGWKLRQKPTVAAAIAERDAQAMDNAGITSTRAWVEVARVAFFDHRKLVDDNGAPIPLHQLDADTVAAIAGIDIEELFAGRGEDRALVGTLKKYRAWNKVDALKMILQARKELVDRHELTGGPIYVIQRAEAEKIEKDLDESV